MVSKKKIHYSCEGSIEKSVPRDHCLSSLGKLGDAKVYCDPWDGFFYPTLTLMIDSYNLTHAILPGCQVTSPCEIAS